MKTPLSRPARWRIATLVLVHLLIAAHIVHWRMNGASLSSIQLSDAGQFAAEGVATAALFLFAALILITAVFGRFFCAWGCHMLALQEVCRLMLGRLGIRPKPIHSRLFWLVPLGLAVYVFLFPMIERAWLGGAYPNLRLQLTSTDLWANLPGPWEGAAIVLVGGLAMVYLLGSLSFCRYLCPYGALFALADKVAAGRIRLTGECDGCARCTAACTTGTRVHEEVQRFGMVANSGCMRCLECVSACPLRVLSYRFGRPALLAGSRAGLTRYALTLGEEVAIGVLFVVLFFSLHGLYGAFPLLVALAISTVVSYVAVVAARLLWRRSVVLRGIVLKRDGRLLVPGAVFGAAVAALILFGVHSLFIRVHERSAARALAAVEFPRLRSYSPEERQLVQAAAADLSFCRRYGLVDTVDWNMRLAWTYRVLRQPALVEEHLRRAIEIDPAQPAARFNLAKKLDRQGRHAEAAAAFNDAVRLDPSLAPFVPVRLSRAAAR